MEIRLITLAPNTFITQCISELCKHFTDSWLSGSEVQRLCARGNWGLHTETHLCVPSANIQHSGVVGFCDKSAHLNVADTVVDTQERLPPKLRDCTSHQSHRHQGGTHTRTCGRRRASEAVPLERYQTLDPCLRAKNTSVSLLLPYSRWWTTTRWWARISCYLWCMKHSRCLQASAPPAPAPPWGRSVRQRGGAWQCRLAWTLMDKKKNILSTLHARLLYVICRQWCKGGFSGLAEMWLALTRRGNVGPSRVGKHLSIPDDSYADLIGTALKSNYDSHGS